MPPTSTSSETGSSERALSWRPSSSAIGDASVLNRLAWIDSRLSQRKRSLEEYRQAFQLAPRLSDGLVRADITTHLAYELFTNAEYEEAVRIESDLLRTAAGQLPLDDERDARLNLSRSLAAMGDTPAAAAELQRLRARLGDAPLTALELLFDARLHIERGQLRAADAMLEQARDAARREGWRLYESAAVTNRIEIGVKEGNWERVHALSSEIRTFQDVLQPDDLRALALLEEQAARAEGKPEESRRLLAQARGLSPRADELWEIDYESGLTLQALGLLEEARKAFELSILEVESQREGVADSGGQAALMGSRHKPYEALFELEAEANEAARALSTLQASFSGRLEAEVAEAASKAGAEVDDALNRSAARRALSESAADWASETAPTVPTRDSSLLSPRRPSLGASSRRRTAPWSIASTSLPRNSAA